MNTMFGRRRGCGVYARACDAPSAAGSEDAAAEAIASRRRNVRLSIWCICRPIEVALILVPDRRRRTSPDGTYTIGALIRDILLVGGGGFIGSIFRYALGSLVTATAGAGTASHRFPVGTLLVNVLGCLAMGLLGAIGQQASPWSTGTRLFLFTGVLGGFTTFSAFGYETFELARTGNMSLALLNVAAQLLLGMAAVVVGYRLGIPVASLLGR